MKKQFMLIDADGDQVWYLDTRDCSDEVLSEGMDVYELCWHRPEGPAVVRTDGSRSWWMNGKQHRTDGPAYIGASGSRCWYVNGKLHRLDGPAFIRADGRQGWYVNAQRYHDNKSFQKAAKLTDEEMSFMIIKYGDVK